VPGQSRPDEQERDARRLIRAAGYTLTVLIIAAIVSIVLACFMGASLIYGW